MRELTIEECEFVAGAGRFSAFFKFLKDVWANTIGSLLAEMLSDDPESPDAPPVGFDPSTIDESMPGLDGSHFGWAWSDTDTGITYIDNDGDGSPDMRTYVSDDGTQWNDHMDGQWSVFGYPQ